jgi:hypothetical protein
MTLRSAMEVEEELTDAGTRPYPPRRVEMDEDEAYERFAERELLREWEEE